MQIYANKKFVTPIETIEIFEPKEIKSVLDKIESLQKKGYYLIGYMRYDLKNSAGGAPLIYFEAFDSFQPFEPQTPDYKIGTIVKPRIFKEEYAQSFNSVRGVIEVTLCE